VYTTLQFKEGQYFSTALLISLSIIVVELLGESVKDALPAIFNWLPFIVMAVLMIVACNRYSSTTQGEVRFRTIFTYGIIVTMLVAVMVVAYRFTYLYMLFPEIKANTIAEARNEMANSSNASENELDAAADLIGRVFIPFAVAGSFVSTLISGIISYVIGAVWVVRKHSTKTP
jgi:hypothetical protein